MTIWRWTLGVGLGLLVGLPLLPPFLGLADPAAWEWSALDLARVVALARNTLLLVAGTLLLALPPGVLLAVFLFRSRWPGRRIALGLLLALLFVPAPVLVSSWQAWLGQAGRWPLEQWQQRANQPSAAQPGELFNRPSRPWATGWGPALWVQAVAGLPWVVCVVGLSLRWVPTELEEESLQQLSARRTLGRVTVPHARAGVAAAVLLVALFTANDISVTGMMQIPTFAEEFDLQFNLGNDAALARTLLLTLPLVLLMWALLVVATIRLERSLPPLPMLLRPPAQLLAGGRAVSVLVLVAVVAVVAIPVEALLWKLGMAGRPPTWAVSHIWAPLAHAVAVQGGQLVQTLAIALLTGAAVAGLALLCCWLALDCSVLRGFLVALLTLAWILPAPVVGIGMKQANLALVQLLPDGLWTDLLYRGPSPLPVMWAQTIRFLPVAVFFLWPVVRLVPRELRDAARLVGAGPLSELLQLAWPLTGRAVGVTALAVTALCLGEVGASARVETPGWEPFAKLIWDRLHYGVDSNVAALCVLLLAAVAALAGAAAFIYRFALHRGSTTPG